MLVVARPVRNGWGDVEEDFEADLYCISAAELSIHLRLDKGYLGDHLGHLSKVGASRRARLCKEVFNQPYSDIIPHALQLLVDVWVVVFVVFA